MLLSNLRLIHCLPLLLSTLGTLLCLRRDKQLVFTVTSDTGISTRVCYVICLFILSCALLGIPTEKSANVRKRKSKKRKHVFCNSVPVRFQPSVRFLCLSRPIKTIGILYIYEYN